MLSMLKNRVSSLALSRAALLLLTVLDVEVCDLPHSRLHLSDVALLEYVLQLLSIYTFTSTQRFLQFILFKLTLR